MENANVSLMIPNIRSAAVTVVVQLAQIIVKKHRSNLVKIFRPKLYLKIEKMSKFWYNIYRNLGEIPY